MDKKRLEIIVTGILILVLVFSWLNSFKVLKKKVSQKASIRTASAQQAAASRTALMPAATREVPGASDKDAEWGRDPFSGKVYSAQGQPMKFKLTGILWDAQEPQAIVNGKIVELGDLLGNYLVVKIGKDTVTLNDGSKDFELKLGQ
jgi:hypothetical protein